MMKTGSANRYFSAIAIYKRQDFFIDYALDLFVKYGIDCITLKNIYEAVSFIARDSGEKTLIVIGTFNELSREHSGFFEYCGEKPNVRCICHKTGASIEWADKKASALISSGVCIVGGTEQLENVLIDLTVKINRKDNVKEINRKKEGKTAEDVQITAEELEALLGDD